MTTKRKKIVSIASFCSGVFVTIVVVLLLITASGLSVFSGFYGVFLYKSSLVSWPVPISNPPPSPSSPSSSNDNDTVDASTTKETSRSGQWRASGQVSGKTHFAEFYNEVKSGSFNDTHGAKNGSSSRLQRALKKTQFGNSTEMMKNGTSLPGQAVDVKNSSPEVKSTVSIVDNKTQEGSSGKNEKAIQNHSKKLLMDCDIFDGEWVWDDSKPLYPAGSCPFIKRNYNCQLNGRPDNNYVKWKWQPDGCDIPSLNATDFLERLRGQRLAFVGDSISRSMWQSLACILRHGSQNKKHVYEIWTTSEFKKNGFNSFVFKDYNCRVDYMCAPFLVQTYKGTDGTIESVSLDLMDKTATMAKDADIIVFNTGHWWNPEKTLNGEGFYRESNQFLPRLEVLEGYKRALTTWAKWVDNNIDRNRTQVFFRGYSVTHFRGGQWKSGGTCHQETEPIFNSAYLEEYPPIMKTFEHVRQGMKTPVTYLNITRLTAYRKDGHPSIYRMEHKTDKDRKDSVMVQDCSHWCMPGVPDTFNELLYASLLKAGKGPWRI